MTRITITIGGHELAAELNETASAQAIAAALPLRAQATRWGDEFYFAIPVELAEATDAQAEVAVGDLAYWPPGNAFCIFFGPTPVSRGEEPRAYSPVNVVGRVLDDVAVLRTVASGAAVELAVVA
ncbi:MAG: cyclophilin-like fold protein [Caldilineaceae bacterium]